jgi:Dynamin family
LRAGKSSVINALLGGRFLEEGILPTTNEINVLKFAEHEGDAGTVQNADGFSVRCLTPGMLSVMQHWHNRIRERFKHAHPHGVPPPCGLRMSLLQGCLQR